MEALVMAAQLLLGLSILVGLHELGHLVAAKVFGMRVEQYYIGFPPKIFGFRYGETEYNLGAIPLGGFVKISGMVDESLDTEKLSEEPKEWEFRAKPAWQRLIVMMGGIIVNVITGIVIFILITYQYGESYVPKEEILEHGIVAYALGKEIGLETGDKIVKVNGQDYKGFPDLVGADVLLGDSSYYTVERNGQTVDIYIPGDFIDKLSDKESATNFIDYRFPYQVTKVEKDSNADKAGLQAGDKIINVNGQSITYFDELQSALLQNAGQEVSLTVMRNDNPDQAQEASVPVTLNAEVNENGTLGFYTERLVDLAMTDYTLAEAIPKGTTEAFEVVWINIKALGKIFSGEVSASKSLSGPIGIAQIFGGTWDWYRFWRITGLLSMVLAFMNFLPIPALDGGHVTFLTYEIISGRKPSDKFLEGAQKVGMVLLLSLMTFAIFNDIFKVIF
ncbi:regulator of sigma E protease [Catalinimonas alkaloidigena]|uniref:RIP metalloprotease RseP n=1 Tax=Catalinimonas alkaloidigena TaxID=1075417 RepID=UPI002405C76E|nr:RIP metalloprotease RseP [Catalinimonas alkaloidigena]MDF9796787.1 regulator of sigma E protease [Catalinimonas alkaloidigena]